jgi:hypothetical protein
VKTPTCRTNGRHPWPSQLFKHFGHNNIFIEADVRRLEEEFGVYTAVTVWGRLVENCSSRERQDEREAQPNEGAEGGV